MELESIESGQLQSLRLYNNLSLNFISEALWISWYKADSQSYFALKVIIQDSFFSLFKYFNIKQA